MKKTIKIAAIAVCFCLIITAVCFGVFKIGHNKAVLSVQNTSANAGDTVMIPVAVSDNPGITDIAFSLEFDNSLLSYKNFYSSILGGCEVFDHSGEGYITLASIDNGGINDSGVLAYFEFDISTDAQIGDLPVALKDLHFDDANGRSVKVETSNGKIEIAPPCPDEHTYMESFLVKVPTCTTPGIIVNTCLECRHNNISKVKATGHSLDKSFTLDVAAANGKPGMLSLHCNKCGAKTNIIIYTEDNPSALGIDSILDQLDESSLTNIVYFLNGGVTYPEIVDDNYNINQLLAGERPAVNSDQTVNADVAIDDILTVLFGKDKKNGVYGTLHRAAIANELPFTAKLLYWLI